MMYVGVYDANPGAIGGASATAIQICNILSVNHRVDLIVHGKSRRELESVFGCAIGASIKDVPQKSWIDNDFERWSRNLTCQYTLFIAISHHVPPRCYASRGMFLCLFPHLTLGSVFAKEVTSTYDTVIANSQYTRRWIEEITSRKSLLLYPPVCAERPKSPPSKINRVLTIGRFTGGRRSKHQYEMVEKFVKNKTKLPEGWKFVCIGTSSGRQRDIDYIRCVEAAAGSDRCVEIAINAPRSKVMQECEVSKVYWHAAGLKTDEHDSPDQVEHFGISTVEAMARGCVPIVIAKGGQNEIISDGKDGFLCDNLDEMVERTEKLAGAEDEWESLSVAAIEKAKLFSTKVFNDRFCGIVSSGDAGLLTSPGYAFYEDS